MSLPPPQPQHAAPEEDELTAEERAAADAEGAAMLHAVRSELQQPGADANGDAAASASVAGGGHATEDDGDEDESGDKVPLGEHLNLGELTLEERDEAAASSSSNTSSKTSSVAASPAMAPAASSSAAAAVQPVDLRDGGSAAASAPAGADIHLGAKKDFFDVRVAVVGNVDAGKSTLIGVLCGGALDNGRGLARSKVFIHAHELGTGRTSAVSQHIMGFDAQGQPVHQSVAASAQSAAKSKSWAQVVHASRSILTFIDLAGHEKYLKTTIAGLTGSHPDYAIVIINSLAGITRMTKEHLGVCLALDIPLICVVSKVDMAPAPVLEQSKKQLFRILKSAAAAKLPIQMRSLADVDTVISNSASSTKLCPVFFVSAVEGTHIDLLTNYLSRLRPHHEWLAQHAAHVMGGPGAAPAAAGGNPTAVEFSIDEVFNVSGIGIVVSGTLNSGTLTPGQTLLLGPQSDGHAGFTPVLVRSLHYKRVNCASVEAGQSCAVAIRGLKKKETLKRNLLRRGQVLVDPALHPQATRFFDAEVLILHHPSTIKENYQAVLHCGMVRQTARLCRLQGECLRTGDKSVVRFRFLQREEYLRPGQPFVFREGSTKGIGKVLRCQFSQQEVEEMEAEEKTRRRSGGRSQMPSTKSAAADGEAAAAGGADVPAGATAAAAPAAAAAHNGKKADAHGHGHSQAAAADKKGHAHGHAKADAAASDKAGGGDKKKWTTKEKDAFNKKEGHGHGHGDKGKK